MLQWCLLQDGLDRAAGLTDTKVARFSASATALRCVSRALGSGQRLEAYRELLVPSREPASYFSTDIDAVALSPVPASASCSLVPKFALPPARGPRPHAMNGFQESAGRILVATLLSAIVGIERQWRGHPAGLRTHMLIGIGAALATLAGSYGFADLHSPPTAPDRIAAQVVSGVGFLGAGAILKERGGIHGLTTAATLWVVALIGLACGAGIWAAAAFATGVLMLTLVPIGAIEQRLRPRPAVLVITIHLLQGGAAAPALEQIAHNAGLTVQGIQHTPDPDGSGSRVVIEVAGVTRGPLSRLAQEFEAVPGVGAVSIQFGGDPMHS